MLVMVMVMLAGCGGGGGDAAAPPPVATVPQPAILFAGAVSAAADGADATGSMGAPIELDAGGSKDADGNALSFAWSIVSKPAGSTLNLANASAAKLVFQADVLGSYVFRLRVTNSKGGFAEKNATVLVNNRVPNTAVVVNASFTAEPVVKPPVSVSAGSAIVLDATGSTDADGDAVTTTWDLIEKPAGSASSLRIAGQVARFSPDVLGQYKVRARGADSKGAYAETVYVFDAANRSPYNVILDTVAIIDRSQQTAIAGSPVAANGALSYDEHGARLSYLWKVESRPATSGAAIASSALPQLAFTPDVAGAYIVSLTVSSGAAANTAYMTLNVLASVPTVVPLGFKPLYAKYSTSLDRVVAVAADPDALKIVHPITGVIKSVMLPLPGIALSLSKNGKLAAVLQQGSVSLVDLEAAKIIRTLGTGGLHTEVALRDDGIVYLTGSTTSSWTRPAVVALNMLTGAASASPDSFSFYGVTRGVFAATKNKALLISEGISPADIYYFTVDPVSGAILTTGDSPYHGDYPMSSPLFLSASEQLVFTVMGNYFDTDTLRFVGNLGLPGQMIAISHSDARGEALVMRSVYNGSPYFANEYLTSYRRFSIAGSLLLPDVDIPLPVIEGQASYGLDIFHGGNGNHVALVQAGSAQVGASGVKYYVVYR